MEEYRKTEDRFFLMLYDYIGFLSALKINRAGQNSLNVKKFQFNETKDKEFILPIVKCTLHNTKNKKRIADVIEPWFVDQYYPRLMRCDSDDYIFMSKEKTIRFYNLKSLNNIFSKKLKHIYSTLYIEKLYFVKPLFIKCYLVIKKN